MGPRAGVDFLTDRKNILPLKEISPRYPLNRGLVGPQRGLVGPQRGLVGPQSRCGLSDGQKKYIALAWIRIQNRSVRGFVTINAALFTGIRTSF